MIMRPLMVLLALWLSQPEISHANPFQRLAGGPLRPEQAFRYKVVPEAGGGAAILWDIAAGYYLYRDKFTALDAEGREIALETPPGVAHDDLNFGTVEVYPFDVALGLPGAAGRVTLGWQGCQEDGICYAPQSAVIELAEAATPSAGIAPAGGVVAGINSAAEALSPSEGAALPLTEVETLKERGGSLWVLLGFAGLGVLLSFTPCSFPMLPVLWAMLGGAPAGSRRAFGIAGFYVAGMAAGFALFGALAGWMGGGLQFLLQQPVVIMTGAAVFLLLAAASLELIPLKMPEAVTRRLASTGGRGSFAGAGLAGLASVLILGPCVTAPLAGGLLYIAQTGDVLLGAAALAMLGLGQGLPLMALALFGRQVLPKSGAWLGMSRIAFAALLVGMAIWLAARVLPGPVGLLAWAMLAFALAAGLHGPDFLRRFLSMVFFAAGLVQLIGAGAGGSDPLQPLTGLASAPIAPPSQVVTTRAELDAALTTAPLHMVYVTAEWCVICRALERDVFSDPEVQQAFAGLPFLKADVTDFKGTGGELSRSLHVIGPPTVLFLDAKGQELAQHRLTGSFTAETLLSTLRKAMP